jgi:cell division protein FtsL
MAPEVLAAIILAAASLATSLVTFFHGHRRLTQESAQRQAEVNKLAAEAERLRAETDALRKRPLEMERRAYQDLLTSFLNPFHDLLTQNQGIYNGLLEGRGALEYHPRSLAGYFNSLPDNDRRKLYWYQRIERLRKNNRRLLALIQQYGGRIVTEDFRDACAEFRYHADEWEDVWKAVEYTLIPLGEGEVAAGDPIPGDKIIGEGESLYANRFPASLQPALHVELDEIRRLAGRTPSRGTESAV